MIGHVVLILVLGSLFDCKKQGETKTESLAKVEVSKASELIYLFGGTTLDGGRVYEMHSFTSGLTI